MDPIGAAASLVTLIALAKEITVCSRDFVRRYRGTPEGFSRVREHVLQLEVQLRLLDSLQQHFSREGFMGQHEYEEVQQVLSKTYTTFSSLKDFLAQFKDGHSMRTRVRWALRDEARTQIWVQQLQQHQNGLTSVLTMLHMLVLKNDFAVLC